MGKRRQNTSENDLPAINGKKVLTMSSFLNYSLRPVYTVGDYFYQDDGHYINITIDGKEIIVKFNLHRFRNKAYLSKLDFLILHAVDRLVYENGSDLSKGKFFIEFRGFKNRSYLMSIGEAKKVYHYLQNRKESGEIINEEEFSLLLKSSQVIFAKGSVIKGGDFYIKFKDDLDRSYLVLAKVAEELFSKFIANYVPKKAGCLS